MSSGRRVVSGKVVGDSSSKDENPRPSGAYYYPNARNPKMEILVTVATVGRDPQSPVFPRVSRVSCTRVSDAATARAESRVRGITSIDEPSHQQSAGEAFLENPRTEGSEGSGWRSGTPRSHAIAAYVGGAKR